MENKEILEFLKDYKELFQNKPENLDWAEIYNLASARFGQDNFGKFTEFWLNRNIHPEKYLTELPRGFCRGSTIKEFIIPDNVTSMSDGTFYDCDSLTSVVIGNSITSIGIYMFADCKSLTNVVIPDSVTSIGNRAFSGCTSLKSIVIGNGVTSIGSYAFFRCSSLTSIAIPNSVTSIGNSTFQYCRSLTSITISDNMANIGKNAFSDCGDKLVVDYKGTKGDWEKIYDAQAFKNTYFTVNCSDGKIVKMR